MKKSMKTSIKILTGCFFASLGLGAITACTSDKADIFPPYKPEVPVSESYRDENVTLDGDFTSDAVWQGAAWHEMQSTLANRNSNNNVTELNDAEIKATAVVADKGVYVGIISNDSVVYVGEGWNDNSAPDVKTRVFGKTGVSMYVTDARNRYKSGKFSYEIGFAADGTYAIGYSGNSTSGYNTVRQGKIYTAAKVDGKLNSDNAQGFSIEVFIPWSAMPGVDLNDKPESLVATFASHRYNNATPKENGLVWEMLDQRYGQGWMETASWPEYGAKGIQPQAEGAVFGTYGHYAYDAGFDVSGDVEGEARKLTFESDPETRRQSYIYVRDVKDTELYAEARFTIGDLSAGVDQYPMLGFSFYGDPATVDETTAACAVHAGITLDTAAANRFNSTFTAAPLNGADFVGQRKFNTNDPFDPTVQSGFKLSVYRKGADFYIFYNDKLYDIKSFPYIQADTETFMGLFIINMPVTVTEYSFYAGEEAAAHGEDKIGGYIPKDYVIDGVADAKWEEYKGAVASLNTEDESGKTFTAKAVMGSNGLYLIAQAQHQYYFDTKTPNGEWANQFNAPGVEGVTNIAVVIGNSNTDYKLHFTISKYGVYACGGGTGANVIGTMKTTDSGAAGSKTRYTSVAECFIPAVVLESVTGGYADGDKNSSNIQLVFVSYNGTEKDNLETAANYRNAGGTDWTWLWPLAVPKTGELNGFAHGQYMKVTADGIEYPAAQAASVEKGEGVTVTGIEHGATYPCGDEITLNVSVADTHVITGITLNGKTIEPDAEGNYKLVYRGGALDLVVTSVRKSAKVTLGKHDGATVTVEGNADLSKDYSDGETVRFTVAPLDEYYAVNAVKVNGGGSLTPVGENTYELAFSAAIGRFDITVEASIVKTDVTFRLTGSDGTVLDSRLNLSGKTITLTNKNDSTDIITLTVGVNNAIELVSKMVIGKVYEVTIDGNLYNFSFADVTIEGTEKAVTLNLKSNMQFTAITDGGYSVDLANGLSVTDINGNRPYSSALYSNENLTGDVWFGGTFRIPSAELRFGSCILFQFSIDSDTKYFGIGHAEQAGGGAGVWLGAESANDGTTYLMDEAYANALTNNGIYMLINRSADGTLNVYFVLNGKAEKVFTGNVGSSAITSWGVRLNCIGLDGRTEDVTGLKYASTAEALFGGAQLGDVTVKINGNSESSDAEVKIDGDPEKFELGKTYSFTVTPADTQVLVEVKLNGEVILAENGKYAFIFAGDTEISVITAEKGKVTLPNKQNFVSVSVENNADLQKQYDASDVVKFTVSLTEEGAKYYEITAVRVNGTVVEAENGTYSLPYGALNKFEITVETKLVKTDVTFKLAGADGTVFDSRFDLSGKTLTFTNKSNPADTFTLVIGANNTVPVAAEKEFGSVYAVAIDGNLYNFSFADVTIEGTEKAVTLNLKSNMQFTAITDGGYSVDLANGLSVTDINGNRPTSEILFNNANLTGEVWFGAYFKSPKAELRFSGAIAFAFYVGGEKKLIAIGDVANSGKAGVGFGTDATQALVQKYENMLTGDGLYVAVRRTAQGNVEVYVLDNQMLVKVFEQNNVGTEAITAWGLRPNCLGLNGRHHDVENLKYGATANELLGNLLGTVGVKVNNSSTDDTATVVFAGNPTEYEFGKTYNFTVAPKSSSYLLTSVTVNGTEVEADNGTYSFVFMGKTEIAVTTAEKGKVTLGTVSDLVTVSVADNDDLSHEYNSVDMVKFTVTLKDPNNEGYYKITVKINGTAAEADNGTYSQIYGDTNTFEISVETELIASDAKITVQPRDTGANGKTGGITLTFTNGSTTFTETADANGEITLTQKPVGTYTVRGKLFGGELKYPDVTLNARNNTATITHGGTYLNYANDNTAIIDYGTSSMGVTDEGAIKRAVLGTQSIEGVVWFTMKLTVPERGAGDYTGFSLYLYSNNDSKEDHLTFMHTGGNGFIKLNDNNSTTIANGEVSAMMKTGLYLAVGRNEEGKLLVRYAATAEGLKTATDTVWACNAGTTAITQVGFNGNGTWANTSAKYVSSGATLEAAIAEMNAYEAKDNA